MNRVWAAGFIFLSCVSFASAQIVVPGADGSDGAFNPTSNTVIDLSLAPDGAWNGPNTSPGNGVYDSSKWAVVFRYSSVNIPLGVTVSFRNRDWNGLKPGNPPVVWLVSGSIVISGGLSLSSYGLDNVNMAIAGPGGFRGAGANQSTAGLGPGGSTVGSAATYGQGSYGNARCLPLVGGSGSGTYPGWVSSGGGGAILLAASGTIDIPGGQIRAHSGHYGGDFNGQYRGSGGAIRLVCNRLQGSGTLDATSEEGGPGRIRIEANQLAFGSVGNPTASFGLPSATAQIWPDELIDPTVRVVSLSSIPISSEPAARFDFPAADINVNIGANHQLLIEANNIPTGTDPPNVTAWNVVARVVPRGSPPFTVNATFSSGTYATSNWIATINLPNGFSAVQVRASMPPQ